MVFKRGPFQLFQHIGNMTVSGVVVDYESSCCPLDRFDVVIFDVVVRKSKKIIKNCYEQTFMI